MAKPSIFLFSVWFCLFVSFVLIQLLVEVFWCFPLSYGQNRWLEHRLHVEAEEDNVVVLHDVFLAFTSHFASFLCHVE